MREDQFLRWYLVCAKPSIFIPSGGSYWCFTTITAYLDSASFHRFSMSSRNRKSQSQNSTHPSSIPCRLHSSGTRKRVKANSVENGFPSRLSTHWPCSFMVQGLVKSP